MNVNAKRMLLAGAAAMFCGLGYAMTTNTWIGAASGDWGDPSNWDTRTVPAADDVAVFAGEATVTPPATFRGCIRNMGGGQLTVAVTEASEFSLALGGYDFSKTGGSFRKTGSGKLTLHAWPGMNHGKVTIAEGAIDFAGNGANAAGAFDEVEIASGVTATVKDSPIATRFGYWFNVSHGVCGGNDLTTFRETGDAAVLVDRCESNAYVPAGNVSTKGMQTLDRAALAFDTDGCPTAAFKSVGNIDGAMFYYRGILLRENPGSYAHNIAKTHGNGIQGRYAIDGTVFKVNTQGTQKFSGQSFGHGWHALTFAGRSDNRYGGGAPAAFNLRREGLAYSGDDGFVRGAKVWNGVCFNALRIASGASFTVADGAALAIANARRLVIDGNFASASADACLYLASDWADATHSDYFALAALGDFLGTVDLGASAVVYPAQGTPSFTLVGEGRFVSDEDATTITISRENPLSIPVNTLDRGSSVSAYAMPAAPDWTLDGTARYSSFLAPNGTDTLTFRSPIPTVSGDTLVLTSDTGAQRASVYLDGRPIAFDDEFSCSFTYHASIKEEYAYTGKYGFFNDLPTYSLGIYLKPVSTADKTGSGWDYLSLPPDVCGFVLGGWFADKNPGRGLWEVIGGRTVSGNPAVMEGDLASGDMFSPYEVTLYYKSGTLTVNLRQGEAETVRTLDVTEAFKKDGRVNFGFVGRTVFSATSDGKKAYGEAAWAWQEISALQCTCVSSAVGLVARDATLSSQKWTTFGAAQWSANGDSVTVLRDDAMGRGGCILNEGIPVYAAFEFSADVYRGADSGYPDQGDNMFGLFVQAAGPEMKPYGGWNSRIGNTLPTTAQAFGGYVGAYREQRCLYWVTNRVDASNYTAEVPLRVAGTDPQTWSCVKNTPLRYTLAYDGLGTFTLTVVKNAAGDAVTSTYYYPQLGDRRYRENGELKTLLYPSFLGTASSMGNCKAVIVSNVQVRAQTTLTGGEKRVLPAVKTVVDDIVELRVGSASGTAGETSEVRLTDLTLAAGSSLRVVPYWEGEAASVAIDSLKVDSTASLQADANVRVDIKSLVFTGERGAAQLQMLNGKVDFSSPLRITIPQDWLPFGAEACKLIAFEDCELAKPINTDAIAIFTDSGRDITTRCCISVSGEGLSLTHKGMMFIVR